jgi:hypothetical protein
MNFLMNIIISDFVSIDLSWLGAIMEEGDYIILLVTLRSQENKKKRSNYSQFKKCQEDVIKNLKRIDINDEVEMT